MVRIGSLHDQMLLDKEARENKTNMTPGEQIDAAVSRIRTLCDRRDRTYADVLKKLEDEGKTIIEVDNAAFAEHFKDFAATNYPAFADWVERIAAMDPAKG